MASSTHEARIELAIADLESQEAPQYRATARKYALSACTLRRRFIRETMSRKAAGSEYLQCLTFSQEEVLIAQINRLTDRGMPPTSQIVRNLAEEIIGRPVGKNWTGDFVKRYKDRLRSVYLKGIDSNRVKSEYAPSYQYFYDLVILLLPFLT
jgi:hypothetical protein